MKVTVEERQKSSALAIEMQPGDIGQVISGVFDPGLNSYLLRTYSGFVLLSDPRKTWGSLDLPHVQIRILPAGSRVTLEVE